jgi:chemotaxis protein MotB
MRRTVYVGAVLFALAVLTAGCSDQELRKLRADNLSLTERLDNCNNDRMKMGEEKGSLLGQLEVCKGQVAKLTNDNAGLNEQIAFLKGEVGKGPKATELPEGLQTALEQFAKEHGELVTLVGDRLRFKNDILFDPGSAKISQKGLEGMKLFADIIKAEGMDLFLRIDGHTDADPIKATKDKYRDNWDLGYERSYQVAKTLFGAGVPEEKVVLASFAMYNPVVAENTKDAKAKNRRVEILLLHTK